MNIGDKIRGIRLMKGLSQENVADMLGLSLLAYGDIERNKKDVTIKRIEQIAQKLEVSLNDIMSYGDSVSNHFHQCNNTSVNTGRNKNQNTNYYDEKEIQHELEKQKLKTEKLEVEIEKLKAQKEKAEMEVKYWKEKVGQA